MDKCRKEPWSRERTFAWRLGGSGSNPAYSFAIFDFEEQLEITERKIHYIAEIRKKGRKRGSVA